MRKVGKILWIWKENEKELDDLIVYLCNYMFYLYN